MKRQEVKELLINWTKYTDLPEYQLERVVAEFCSVADLSDDDEKEILNG